MGTCALIQIAPGTFELAKMAVTEAYQGMGIGGQLYEYSEAWARNNGGLKIVLSSNTKLTPALNLYEKKGFIRLNKKVETEYSRCNVQYEKLLVRIPH